MQLKKDTWHLQSKALHYKLFARTFKTVVKKARVFANDRHRPSLIFVGKGMERFDWCPA
jgi:hypothetical protein